MPDGNTFGNISVTNDSAGNGVRLSRMRVSERAGARPTNLDAARLDPDE
jgi:hypothetical protein